MAAALARLGSALDQMRPLKTAKPVAASHQARLLLLPLLRQLLQLPIQQRPPRLQMAVQLSILRERKTLAMVLVHSLSAASA